jgi:hypothetical protein
MTLHRARWFWAAAMLAALGGAFWAGAMTYRHREAIARLWSSDRDRGALESPGSYRRDTELLRGAFKAKIIDRQLFAPCQTPGALHAAIDRMSFPASAFAGAYEKIRISNQELSGGICRIDYQVDDRSYSSYAYFLKVAEAYAKDRVAVLIIPGTGLNQSTEIVKGNPENYQSNIVGAFDGKADVYVYVKPNEDFLAIHNGEKKIREEFFVRFLLNKGGSYSAKYLVDTLSFSKFLKSAYSKLIVVGLSQGGEAALLNALQSTPDLTVVASGFSVLNNELDWADCQQIIIPGLRQYYSNEKIRDMIGSSRTQYLFTYGQQELGAYKVEAEEQATCKYLAGLANVSCAVHGKGHVYDLGSVKDFLSRHQWRGRI